MSEKSSKKGGTYSSLTGFKRAVPIILTAVAVFCALCFITQGTGAFGRAISSIFLGLFSIGGYFIPFLLVVHAFFYPSDVYKMRLVSRAVFSVIALIMISTITHAVTYWGEELTFSIGTFYKNGTENKGGGVIGGGVAYALTAIFGPIGLTIIAILVFALYITYFFAGGKPIISKILLKILTAISDFFARKDEKKKKKQAAKLAKSEKRKSRARAEEQADLLDDEFFSADNGLKELAIPDLGIREVRSDRELESNPTLQNKVRRNSDYEAADSESINVNYETDSTARTYSSHISRSADASNSDNTIYDAHEKKRSYGLDENAGDVFTSDFDPFDLKLNEELMGKQSSKAQKSCNSDPEGIGEFAEPLYEISKEEIDKARERADFEMKKRAALDAQKRYNAARTEIKPAAGAEPEVKSEQASEPVPEKDSEPYIPEYIKHDTEIKVYPAPEQKPILVDFTEEEAESIKEELKISRSMLNPTAEQSTHESAVKHGTPADDTPIYGASANQSSSESMTFEFETDAEENDEDGGSFTNVSEEMPEEETDSYYEEIPEEEQNETVKEYRKMFTFLSEEESENSEAPEDKEQDEKVPSEIIFDDDYEENEASETIEEEEEDDIPFTSTVKAERHSASAPESQIKARADYSDYKFPSFDLLARGKVEEDPDQENEKNQNADILVDSLLQFNVKVSIKGVDRGPRITRYEIVPVRGVKVSAVTSLFNDVALRLGAEGIRMEAPIPGKTAIGVEIPNKKPSTVFLRDLVESDEFIRAESKTMCCLGKDVTGNPVFADIAKMPHVLVAGATGMGKSVCINAILMSILYKARPDEVKFIMIDPKKVEFKGYNGIPHLLIPVVTDVKQAAGALMWAVEQMEKRYEIMEQFDVKKIDTYNEQVRANPELGEPLPKIIIVIDELNDIMLQVRKPAEDLIMSIAQKARAAGIHLIIGTQRPSVDVVTGVIKANIPSRISCKVASYIDSKTILEQAGAEKLLNNGDMLYISAGAPKALRVQGAFVSDAEVAGIMKHIKAQVKGNIYDEQALEEINRAAQKCTKGSKSTDDDFDDEDDGESTGVLNDQKFLDAVELAIRSGKISTSLIQRKISVGYSKAAKFIDSMEDLGIVSESNGQKPRDILISSDEWHEMLARRSMDD